MKTLAKLLLTGWLLWAVGTAWGESARSQNFIVTANRNAATYAQQAERYYEALAVDWLGKRLPPLTQPMAVTIKSGPNMGNGGATALGFTGAGRADNGEAYAGTWQGTHEGLMNSVIPHEVFHVVLAKHIQKPLPRWIDEGICGTVEASSEQLKLQKRIWASLHRQGGSGFPFNQMFAMKEYPRDVLTFYGQAHSATWFLLAHGGKPCLMKFVETGSASDDWHAALKSSYGYDTSELQTAWLSWVQAGNPVKDNAHEVGYRWDVAQRGWYPSGST